MDAVYNSRNNKANSEIGASNSITVLNVSHFSFSGKDLSSVKILWADLSGGEFF